MSYNFGAGNKERVKKAFFTQFTVCTVFTGCFWLIMLLFPRLFAGIFSNDTDLITYTAWALRIYMAGIFFTGIPGFLSAELYGTGTGEGQSAACMLKKTDPVDSADLYSAAFHSE